MPPLLECEAVTGAVVQAAIPRARIPPAPRSGLPKGRENERLSMVSARLSSALGLRGSPSGAGRIAAGPQVPPSARAGC